MTNASHIASIEHELDGFHQSLVIYRQQMDAWYSRALDSVSHTADMPSLLGMDRVLRVGDSQTTVSMSDPNFIGSVAVCQLGGELKIESKFDSVYDVPIGGIPVEVIGLDDGSSTRVMLDEHGKGSHHCAAGGRYQVRVQGGVSQEQVDALFTSYAGLMADLECGFANSGKASNRIGSSPRPVRLAAACWRAVGPRSGTCGTASSWCRRFLKTR